MKTRRPVIYLASQSVRRRQILRQMRVPFLVVPSAYREQRLSRYGPEELVLKHAEGKALRSKPPKKNALVLGADTIVYCQGKILGKPRTMKEAHAMISLIQGRFHEVYTGVCLYHPAKRWLKKGFVRTKVLIRKMSPGKITEYFKRVDPFDKAGAYAIQMKPSIIRKMIGSYSNVVGLPREMVREFLKSARRAGL